MLIAGVGPGWRLGGMGQQDLQGKQHVSDFVWFISSPFLLASNTLSFIILGQGF